MVCVPDAHKYAGIDDADRPWTNWAETIRQPIPRYLSPATLTDLCQMARDATVAGVELHALGSGWAYEDVALSDDWVINIDSLCRPLTGVVENALTDDWRAAHHGPGPDRLFHVEAGIKIWDLNDKLDAAGLAMETLGGANGQSLAGAISTSTHGGDILLPPIGDAVQAIHLVTTGGREVWIERASAPLTTDVRLRPYLCYDAQIRRDDDLFDAALVACGRFGVIYALVLRVRPTYRLAEHTVRVPVADVHALLLQGVENGSGLGPLMAALPEPPAHLGADPAVPARFLQIVSTTQGNAACWVTRRWETTVTLDLNPTLPGPWCGAEAAPIILLGTAAALDQEAVILAMVPFVGLVWSAELFMRANELRLAIAEHLTTGEAAARALTAAWRSNLGFVAHHVNEMQVGNRLARSEDPGRRGSSYVIMTGGSGGDDCFRARATEVMFPGNTRAYLDYLSELTNAHDSYRQAGYISLRFSAPSRALISMLNFPAPYVVSIEVAVLSGLEQAEQWVAWAARAGRSFGGRPHWGQEHDLTGIDVERMYPALERWREALRSVSGSAVTFSNAFTRRCGLEPAPIPRAATVQQVTVTTGPFSGPGPGITATYDPVDFGGIEVDLGAVEVGAGRMATVAFRNGGASPLQLDVSELSSAWGPAGLRVDHSTPAATGETAEVYLVLFPTAPGPISGRLGIMTTTQTTPQFLIPVRAVAHGHQVSADSSLLDFAGVEIGGSAVRTLRLVNSGDRPGYVVGAVVAAVGDGGPQDEFEVTPVSGIVAEGGTLDLVLTYRPTRPGPARARLTVYLDRPTWDQRISVDLVGTGLAPLLVLTPPELTFPDTPVRRESVWQSVQVANNGTADLRFAVTADREFETAVLDTSRLAPGQWRTLLVRFDPASGGPRSGLVRLTGNIPDGRADIPCAGTGLAEALPLLDPPSVSFGPQPTGTTGGIRTIRLTNDGTIDLQVQSVQLAGAHPGDFVVEQSAAGAALRPEGARDLGVRFAPTATGDRSADLVVTSNGFGGPRTVPLAGHGVAPPPLAVTPTEIGFRDTAVGTTVPGFPVEVVNNGTAPIEVVDLRLGGTHPGDFAVAAGALPAVVAVGGRHSWTVEFTPRAIGTRTAELVFNGSAGETVTVVLRGTGTGSTLVFDPPDTDFGPMIVGGSTDPLAWITVTNTGNAPVSLGTLVIEGDFIGASSCSGAVLGPGRDCTVRLRFRPSGTGPRTGRLLISDADGREHTAALRGTGALPVVSAQPTALDLAAAGAEETVVVTNTGTWVLTLRDAVLDGPDAVDFAIVAGAAPAVVTNGGKTEIRIRFTPTAPGQRTARLRFTSNAPGSPHAVSLRGTS